MKGHPRFGSVSLNLGGKSKLTGHLRLFPIFCVKDRIVKKQINRTMFVAIMCEIPVAESSNVS